MSIGLTRRLPQRVATALAAFLLAPLSAALTGCEADQVGAAAIVNGKPFAIEQLQDLTRSYLAAVPGADKGDAQQQILNRIIASAVIDRAASRVGVSATRGEVAAERDNVLGQVGGRRELIRLLAQNREVVAPAHVDRWVRDRILVNKIVEKVSGGRDPNTPEVNDAARKAFVSAARSVDIEVNPRYGRWDSEQLSLSGQVGGGLSRPVSELRKGARGE